MAEMPKMTALSGTRTIAEGMTRYPRLRMQLALAEQAPSCSWRPRAIRADDVPALGPLLLAAYRGTVDDEGESESDASAEVGHVMDGEYGQFLPDCSFVVVVDEEGRPIGASMVTLFESEPVLAYIVVDPAVKRRGVGTSLVAASGNALLSAGYSTMDLFVTEANEPAANLYRKLGFQVVDRVTQPR
jgi:ribosomal protein S18 acetylase RimI-like enzyme